MVEPLFSAPVVDPVLSRPVVEPLASVATGALPVAPETTTSAGGAEAPRAARTTVTSPVATSGVSSTGSTSRGLVPGGSGLRGQCLSASRASLGRWLMSRLIIHMTHWQIEGERSGRTCSRGMTRCCRCAFITCGAVSPLKGYCPVSAL